MNLEDVVDRDTVKGRAVLALSDILQRHLGENYTETLEDKKR